MDWEPVLRGDAAVAARNRLFALAKELFQFDFTRDPVVDLADRILLCAYLSVSGAPLPWRDQIVDYLNAASTPIPQDVPSGMFTGLSSIGWTIQHLHHVFGVEEGEDGDAVKDPLEDLEQVIVARLRVDRWSESYDLVSGLAGIGVFFLERLPSPAAAEGLSLILGHLETLAEISVEGTTWHTPPRLLPQYQRAECPTGHYNLGVAHGVPGLLYLLSEAIAVGIEAKRASYLFEGALRWLLARQQPAEPRSSYAHWIAQGESPRFAHPAWCYGDLGIAAVLSHVGARLDRADVSCAACALLQRCLARTVMPAEPTLCHGALGVAHIYNRIYQVDPRSEYKQAANYYYEGGLTLLDQCRRGVSRRGGGRQLGVRFLQGAVGVALALLSAAEPIEPQWDRRFMLSGRPS